MTHYDLTGKTALITGAAGLLGQEHAYALAALGADIVLTDVNMPGLRSAQKRLQQIFQQRMSNINSRCNNNEPDRDAHSTHHQKW